MIVVVVVVVDAAAVDVVVGVLGILCDFSCVC